MRQLTRRGIAFVAIVVARDAFAQDKWAAADSAAPRLAPAAFKTLPPAVRTDLERRGCRIPQVAGVRGPTNVIAGSFRGKNTADWAILCSVDLVSRVLVYPGESGKAVDSLFEAADRQFLQTVGAGRIGFSRMISTSSAQHIRPIRARYKTPSPAITHDGIEIAFVDRASSIYYWTGKRWMEFAGSD